METLYLTEPEVALRRVGKALRLEYPDGAVERAWLSDVRRIFIFGEVSLDQEVLIGLAADGITIAWLTGNGHLRAQMGPGVLPGPPAVLRAQYQAAADPVLSLENARAIVRARLRTQAGFLRRHKRNVKIAMRSRPRRRLTPEQLRTLWDRLWDATHEIDLLLRDARRAKSIRELRGIEGRAGAIYFGCWGMLLRGEEAFLRRARRPAPDPVNALLSLTYGLLRLEIESQLVAVGLDPRVGFLHVEHGHRPALALDLLEEFRAPIADRLVLRLINYGLLRPRDFVFCEDGSCRLSRLGRAVFFPQYERTMEKPFTDLQGRRINYRRLLHIQAREMAAACRDRRPYVPHQPRL